MTQEDRMILTLDNLRELHFKFFTKMSVKTRSEQTIAIDTFKTLGIDMGNALSKKFDQDTQVLFNGGENGDNNRRNPCS